MHAGATFNKDSSDFLANFENFNFVKDGAAKEFVIGVKVRAGAEEAGVGLRGVGQAWGGRAGQAAGWLCDNGDRRGGVMRNCCTCT